MSFVLYLPNTQHPTPNTQHPRPKTQHPTPNTQDPTPNTQHPTPNTQQFFKLSFPFRQSIRYALYSFLKGC
ncbi:hypothetical protein [uncultured Dokdonia sp.]|uniref:hypothetical protein n=1 Tax=uncultured Dokdonia sp. TaxID=575653 RepID=UPI0026355CFA|nr:hypothetical protein [uncultured Dokdonia sp.]